MKKALDYVSDYQLKSACKDAMCIAPSKIIQMIFAKMVAVKNRMLLTIISTVDELLRGVNIDDLG